MSDLDQIFGVILSIFALVSGLLVLLTWLEATLDPEYGRGTGSRRPWSRAPEKESVTNSD